MKKIVFLFLMVAIVAGKTRAQKVVLRLYNKTTEKLTIIPNPLAKTERTFTINSPITLNPGQNIDLPPTISTFISSEDSIEIQKDSIVYAIVYYSNGVKQTKYRKDLVSYSHNDDFATVTITEAKLGRIKNLKKDGQSRSVAFVSALENKSIYLDNSLYKQPGEPSIKIGILVRDTSRRSYVLNSGPHKFSYQLVDNGSRISESGVMTIMVAEGDSLIVINDAILGRSEQEVVNAAMYFTNSTSNDIILQVKASDPRDRNAPLKVTFVSIKKKSISNKLLVPVGKCLLKITYVEDGMIVDSDLPIIVAENTRNYIVRNSDLGLQSTSKD